MTKDGISEEIDALMQGDESNAHPAPGSPAQRSQAIVSLASSLQYERDRRKEERFLFVAIITVLVDGYLFAEMTGWAGQIVIGIIQLFGLAVYARHCGIEEVGEITDKILDSKPLAWLKKEKADRAAPAHRSPTE